MVKHSDYFQQLTLSLVQLTERRQLVKGTLFHSAHNEHFIISHLPVECDSVFCSLFFHIYEQYTNASLNLLHRILTVIFLCSSLMIFICDL